MAVPIENIPAEMRWQEATKGLTGACTALMNALKESVGEEKFSQFQVALWSEAGKGAKELADNLGLTVENPKDVEEVTQLLAVIGMGPEFEFEIVEATEDKSVGRATKCCWYERIKELGLKEDLCTSGHQGWGDGATESLNPNFAFNLTKNMARGDSYCEWVIKRKK